MDWVRSTDRYSLIAGVTAWNEGRKVRVIASRCIVGAWLLAGLLSQACAQGIYTCQDGKGRRLSADRLIPECTDREQRELNASGSVKRTVPPVLTAKERAAEEAKAQQAADERKRIAEEKKRELALLSRYPDKSAHDKERRSAIAVADDVIESANHRIAELQVERKKIDGELEFYRKDLAKVPAKLKRLVEENSHQVEEQNRVIANQEKEKRRINARFDEELVNLRRLWAQSLPAAASSAPAAAAAPSSGANPTLAGAKSPASGAH